MTRTRWVVGVAWDLVAAALVGLLVALFAVALVLGPAYGAMLREVAAGRGTADYTFATLVAAPFIGTLFTIVWTVAGLAAASLLGRRWFRPPPAAMPGPSPRPVMEPRTPAEEAEDAKPAKRSRARKAPAKR